jgi:hypothetical protein
VDLQDNLLSAAVREVGKGLFGLVAAGIVGTDSCRHASIVDRSDRTHQSPMDLTALGSGL